MANPFAFSRWYHRLSNAYMPQLFRLLPMPRGFVLLTATGRRSGRQRRRPVRAIRHGDTLYAVALLGDRSDWLRNVRAEQEVTVKVGTRMHTAFAREVTDPAECESAVARYVDTVVPFDYPDCAMVHWSLPTPANVREAHRQWLGRGVLVAIDLQPRGA